jgi:PAS domain S-box-containing protein
MKAQRKTSKPNNRGKSKSGQFHESKPARVKRTRPLAPEQFVDIIEHINDGLVVLDKDWHYVYVNQKAAAMLQRQKPSDLIGKHIWTEYPEGVGQPFYLAYEKAMRDQLPVVFEDLYEPWDLWFENRIYPSPEGLLILFTEVTDRKRIERLLNERQYFLQKILDTEPGTVYIYDLEERRNVYVNRYWLLAFGYTEEETQAMDDQLLIRIIHPDDLALISTHHENWQQADEGNIREIEYRVRSKAGEWHWLHSHEAAFARDESGRVKQILGISYEITPRKLAQEALRRSEQQLGLIYDTVSDIIFLLSVEADGRYRFISVNKAFLQTTGLNSDQVIGRYADEIIPPSSRHLVFGNYKKAIQERAPVTWEEVSVYPTGQKTAVVTVNAVYNEADICTHLVGAIHDITESKQMEKVVLKERDFSDAMLNSLPGIFYFYDQSGKFLRWNRNLEIVSGYSGEEIARINPLHFFGGAEKAYIARRIQDVFEYGESDAEANLISKNGKQIPYYFTGRRIEIEHVPYLIGMGIDITQRRQAENELRKLNLELEQHIAARTDELAAAMIRAQESDRLKSAFLATMSHELRTPLNSIIGFTGVILQGLAGPLNQEQTKQLNMIRDSARHLLALINDVLDISKIEAGQLEILKLPFDMRQIIESVLRVIQPLAQKKNLQLVTSIGVKVGTVNNDRRRVEQVLINLVNNAIKFTEHGNVRIECLVSDGWLETRVRDTGIGIKPEDMHKLFTPFQQIETGLTRHHEGTGLGLSICKHLVTAMGGEIIVESEWGVGSTFKFILPL